ncbi:MAG: hypothetical protein J6S19_08450, partial [Lentisphaeria bacterium]|nr:hypothetical protein [Lentisphaeria bacterium]
QLLAKNFLKQKIRIISPETQVVKCGVCAVKTAREQLEKELGHSGISPENAKSLGIAENIELPFKNEDSQ